MGLDMGIRHNGEEIIYMRKVNCIRRWCAENLENFEDNGLTNFPKEKFEELIVTMYDVITEGGIKDFYDEYIDYCYCEKEDEDDKWNKMWNKWGPLLQAAMKDIRSSVKWQVRSFHHQAVSFSALLNMTSVISLSLSFIFRSLRNSITS